jgi:Ca2+-binding RTX toxin-like protein
MTISTADAAATLIAGEGQDTLKGGYGFDHLFGGPGADLFVFTSASHSQLGAADVIEDWNPGDLIALARIDANETVRGNQAFTLLGEGAAFSAAGQLLLHSETDPDGAVHTLV